MGAELDWLRVLWDVHTAAGAGLDPSFTEIPWRRLRSNDRRLGRHRDARRTAPRRRFLRCVDRVRDDGAASATRSTRRTSAAAFDPVGTV